MSATITWYGQATTAIASGGKVLLIDPWFNGNPVCPIKPEELDQVDLVAVTHGHFDHFGDALSICRDFGAKLVCTPEIAWYADSKGIPRGDQAVPMGYGGEVELEGFSLAMVQAWHPSALYGEEWESQKKFIPDGGAAGYVITTQSGEVIYHAGDTSLFSDLTLIAQRYAPQVGLLPIGGRFTMDARDAGQAAAWLGLKTVIPIHFNTFPILAADPQDLIDAMEENGAAGQAAVLQPGDSLKL